MFLLDGAVLSMFRRCERNPQTVPWVATQRTADRHLSVVTVGEVERGITQQERHDPSFSHAMAVWLDRPLTCYCERILLVDASAARRWGQSWATLVDDTADLLIADTALEHGLTVVIRSGRNFEPTEVPTRNRFE